MGLIRVSGDNAAPLLQQSLTGKDADARSVALGQIAEVDVAALKVLAESIDRFPAEVRLAQKKLNEASALVDRAIAIAPEYPFTYSDRALVKRQLGDSAGALAEATSYGLLFRIAGVGAVLAALATAVWVHEPRR